MSDPRSAIHSTASADDEDAAAAAAAECPEPVLRCQDKVLKAIGCQLHDPNETRFVLTGCRLLEALAFGTSS